MWPKEYVELQQIENSLFCGICYEYMQTSVMTTCSHSYCSLCIRKYLHYKTQCPTCFTVAYEKDLRKNKVLDEIIELFLKIKDKLKRCLQIQVQFMQNENSDVTLNSPRVTSADTDICLIKHENKIINKNINPINNGSPTHVQKDLSSPSTSGRPKIPLMFTPKSTKRPVVTNNEDVKVVICPVCKVTISELHINKHLDDCLKRERNVQPKVLNPERVPLPKLVFSVMRDSMLKKKLKESGLSIHGNRRACEARMQRYIILYNAECDKLNPRPVSEIIKQCEDEENLEKKINKNSSVLYKLQATRNADQNVIDDERKKYLETYKDSFQSLINQIKSVTPSKKSSVKRNTLSESAAKDEEVSQEAVAGTSDESMNDNAGNEASNKAIYVPESDSDSSCPMQFYSSDFPNGIRTPMTSTKHYSNSSNDIPGISKNTFPAMTTIAEKNLSETNSKRKSGNAKYRKLFPRNEKLTMKEESSESIVSIRGDFDSNNASDEEGIQNKGSTVLQDIVYDLSSNDGIENKFNRSTPSFVDHGLLNNTTLNSTSWEKENLNSSPECSERRSLRKRSREIAQNDKIASNTTKKMKKTSHYVSETDESNNEESVNDREQSRSRVRKQILNTSIAETAANVRQSVRIRRKNNIQKKR